MSEQSVTIDPRDNIDDVMDNFDFHKVAQMMEAVNWKWWGSPDTPTEGELRATARKRLIDAHECALKHCEDYSVSSGGFKATCHVDDEGAAFTLFWGEEYTNYY